MNERQIEIANLLLNRLEEKEGQLNIDQVTYFTKEKNYGWPEVSSVMDSMMDESVIKWYGDEKYRIKLTTTGYEAVKTGYKDFIKLKKTEPQTFINSNINYGINQGNQSISNSINSEPVEVNRKRHSQMIFWAVLAIIVTIIIAIVQHYA